MGTPYLMSDCDTLFQSDLYSPMATDFFLTENTDGIRMYKFD